MSKRQIIAVDIDDVLVDHYEALVDFHNNRYGTNHTIDDYVSDHWSQVWGTTHEETKRRAEEFASLGVHNRKIKKDASRAVKILKQTYDLSIVTARRKVNVESTKKWLEEFLPGVFQDVHFLPIWDEDTEQTKADICRELGADYLIDDSLKHCGDAIQNGLTALLFGNYSWNQAQELPQGLKRVNNWQEVLDHFDARS